MWVLHKTCTVPGAQSCSLIVLHVLQCYGCWVSCNQRPMLVLGGYAGPVTAAARCPAAVMSKALLSTATVS